MLKGHPIFVSLCLSRYELNEFVKQNFPYSSIKKISFEIFSIYDQSGSPTTFWRLHFDQIFKEKQVLYFYLPTSPLPKEFQGNFKVRNY